MRRRNMVGFLSLALLAIASGSPLWAQGQISIRGKVTTKGSPLEGAYVGAHAAGKTFTTYVMTDRNGQFTFRGLAPGSYGVLTRIPGFRTAQKDGVAVQGGRDAVVDFPVEQETNFRELVEQASNAELLESFPLSKEQREVLDHRCTDCHGEYYIAKSKFSPKDWALIVAKMDDAKGITPPGDLAPPPPFTTFSRRDAGTTDKAALSDEAVVKILAQIRGPQSPDFPVQWQPRATGSRTRAVVTEYQIPRLGATPRAVRVDPRGSYVWYTDWRANYLGRIEVKTGEIKEYPIAGRDDRPPGFQYMRWDPNGDMWLGQIWSGRQVRFDTRNERVLGIWGPPQEWARTGSVGICLQADGSVKYRVSEGLIGTSWFFEPATGTFTEIKDRAAANRMKCESYPLEENHWDAGWSPGGGKRAISYQDPATGKVTDFPVIAVNPWARPYNAIGDPVRKVGWTVPDAIDRIIKVDATTGQLTDFPLPSHGKEIRNIDIEMSANPPAVWFVNQRLGRVVRFQEYAE